jgi:hypothetical protein
MSTGSLFAWILVGSTVAATPQVGPVLQPILIETLQEWTFEQGTDGWIAERHCVLGSEAGMLKVQATEDDPYMHCPVDLPGGHLVLHMKARSTNGGGGSIFWITRQSPRRGEDKAKHFSLSHDGQWHEYEVPFQAPGTLVDLRIDPGGHPGRFEIDWIRIDRHEPHPLAIEKVQVLDDKVRCTVRNHRNTLLEFSAADRTLTVPGEETVEVDLPIRRDAPIEVATVELTAADLPPVRRTVFLHHAEIETDWIVRSLEEYSVQIARDGTLARVKRDDELLAILAPLVHREGKVPELRLKDEDSAIRFQGDGITLTISMSGNEITTTINCQEPCEGPVVRALGGLEQGLFAGLEYLGKGEQSSSKLDVETEDHLRFAPDPLKVTMPLAAFVTDRVSVAMTWSDMQLEPVYATPNFFDQTDDHRMALRGEHIQATVRIGTDPLEQSIAWAVEKWGLPPIPEAPRNRQEQWDLCMAALDGPLKTSEGWGHCVEERWQRRWHADMASTVWRITGERPALPEIVPGGSHIRNESIYFVTGRVSEWLDMHKRQVRQILNRQQPDGSFRYSGKYARGHFEDTASGVCARPAATLLEYAWITGDAEAEAAGLRALDYMKRFRTPRGAQVWEVPLHTPDLLASAYLVWAYVRGFELTGNDEYRLQARKWALSGVPFVYLWGRYPVMPYATPPVFGATNWKAPVWIGLPVQWVGIVYAYALTMVAPYDDTLDWNHLARGILVAGEQMQFPDGPYVGLLPDAFALPEQERRPWRINPCSLVSLRQVLDGEVNFLSVATDDKHRVAAPFPVTLRHGRAHIEARPGVDYQLLVDGERIVNVSSQGKDVVPLD